MRVDGLSKIAARVLPASGAAPFRPFSVARPVDGRAQRGRVDPVEVEKVARAGHVAYLAQGPLQRVAGLVDLGSRRW